jgi:hypothetical protein
MLKYLVVVGAIVQLLGILSYIKGTIRGETKPNRVTWLIWSIAPMIATVAAIASGITWAVLPVFMSGFGPFLVFLASFVNKKAYWKLETFDYLCGLFSILALVLWAISKEPVVAIVFAILSDFSAAIPTLIKSIKHPETESAAPYSTGMVNSLTSFFAIKLWTVSAYAFPVYLVLVNFALLLSVYWQRIRLKTKQ